MTRTRTYLVVLVIAACALSPLVMKNEYHVRVLANLGIWMLLTTGLEIVAGACGQLSLGHAAFYGIGGYTSAILTLKAGLPFWASLPVSAVAAMGAGFLVGIPSLRFRGPYLVLVTIAFNYITHTVFLNWKSVTGGYEGMTGVPVPRLFGFEFGTPHRFVYIVIVLATVLILIYYRLHHSSIGRAWLSIRESESASEACGVPVSRFKLLAFAISTLYAGVAGCLFVHLNRFVSPEPFNFDVSVHILAMLVIGGLYRPFGGVTGAVILTFANEYLATFPLVANLLFGVLLIVILKFMPDGVVGLVSRVWANPRRGWGVANG